MLATPGVEQNIYSTAVRELLCWREQIIEAEAYKEDFCTSFEII